MDAQPQASISSCLLADGSRIFLTTYSASTIELFARLDLRLPYLPYPVSDKDDVEAIDSALGAVLLANLNHYIDATDLVDSVCALSGEDTVRTEQLRILVDHLDSGKIYQPGKSPRRFANRNIHVTDAHKYDPGPRNYRSRRQSDGTLVDSGRAGREWFVRLLRMLHDLRKHKGSQHDIDRWNLEAMDNRSLLPLLENSGKTNYEAYIVHRLKVARTNLKTVISQDRVHLFQASHQCCDVWSLPLRRPSLDGYDPESTNPLRIVTPVWRREGDDGELQPWEAQYDPANPPTDVVGLYQAEGTVDMSMTRTLSSYNTVTMPLGPNLLPPKNTTLTDSQVGTILELIDQHRLLCDWVHSQWPATFDIHGNIHLNRVQHGLPALRWFEPATFPGLQKSGYYFVVFKGIYSLCGRAMMLDVLGRNTEAQGRLPLRHQRPGFDWETEDTHLVYTDHDTRSSAFTPDLDLKPIIHIVCQDLPHNIDASYVEDSFLRFLASSVLVPRSISYLATTMYNSAPAEQYPVNSYSEHDKDAGDDDWLAARPLSLFLIPSNMNQKLPVAAVKRSHRRDREDLVDALFKQIAALREDVVRAGTDADRRTTDAISEAAEYGEMATAAAHSAAAKISALEEEIRTLSRQFQEASRDASRASSDVNSISAALKRAEEKITALEQHKSELESDLALFQEQYRIFGGTRERFDGAE